VVAIDAIFEARDVAVRERARADGLIDAEAGAVAIRIPHQRANAVVVDHLVAVVVDTVSADLVCVGIHRFVTVVAVRAAELPGDEAVAVAVLGVVDDRLRHAGSPEHDCESESYIAYSPDA